MELKEIESAIVDEVAAWIDRTIKMADEENFELKGGTIATTSSNH
jgi:hypothetical protein